MLLLLLLHLLLALLQFLQQLLRRLYTAALSKGIRLLRLLLLLGLTLVGLILDGVASFLRHFSSVVSGRVGVFRRLWHITGRAELRRGDIGLANWLHSSRL